MNPFVPVFRYIIIFKEKSHCWNLTIDRNRQTHNKKLLLPVSTLTKFIQNWFWIICNSYKIYSCLLDLRKIWFKEYIIFMWNVYSFLLREQNILTKHGSKEQKTILYKPDFLILLLCKKLGNTSWCKRDNIQFYSFNVISVDMKNLESILHFLIIRIHFLFDFSFSDKL